MQEAENIRNTALHCSPVITQNNLVFQEFDQLSYQQRVQNHRDIALQLPTAGTLVEGQEDVSNSIMWMYNLSIINPISCRKTFTHK